MANKLSVEKKAAAVGMLCEGTSIRAVERITGIHRDTIMRLGVRMGKGCQRIMDEKMRNLPCKLIQVDEVWGYDCGCHFFDSGIRSTLWRRASNFQRADA